LPMIVSEIADTLSAQGRMAQIVHVQTRWTPTLVART
jgi:hypothetical protein